MLLAPTTYRCSFCGKTQDEVQRLIAGPRAVYACDECVHACSRVIEGADSARALPDYMHIVADADTSQAICAFCGKRRSLVRVLFAGPNGVHICDECIALCDEIVAEESSREPVPPAEGPRWRMRSGRLGERRDARPARRHLLDVDDWSPDEFRALLASASAMRLVLEHPERKLDTLRGRLLVNLFYENSTRTRVSFELAGKQLGADVTNVTASASSVTKGESLVDTVRTLQALGASIVVVRSSESGAPDVIARAISGAVINAGDGWHAHPTQALLDLLTLSDTLGDLAGKHIVILGDILHSRVARSNLWALTAMGAEVVLCGPPTLLPLGTAALYASRPVPGTGARRHVRVEPRIDAALEGADAVMVLRLQKERQQAGLLPSIREYTLRYGLTPERLRLARPSAVVLHPGPMNEGVEIDAAVASGNASQIERQVTNGVATRMAVLDLLCGEGAA